MHKIPPMITDKERTETSARCEQLRLASSALIARARSIRVRCNGAVLRAAEAQITSDSVWWRYERPAPARRSQTVG